MASTYKQRLKTLALEGAKRQSKGVRGIDIDMVSSPPIPSTSPEIPNVVRTNTPKTHNGLGFADIVQILEKVCADDTHPRFLDAVKVLADLKQMKGAKDVLSAEDIDPSAFVQMVARASRSYHNVRPFLEKEILPRIGVKTTS